MAGPSSRPGVAGPSSRPGVANLEGEPVAGPSSRPGVVNLQDEPVPDANQDISTKVLVELFALG